MNPVLLLPAGLAALAALAVPLLLHLARREERRPVDFAALRWLSERVRPRRDLRFQEPLLLALRLLLLALLALLLARPALEDDADGIPWVVAAPGVAASALQSAPGGTGGAVERRWLAPGFPPGDQAPPTGDGTPSASLLRELDMRIPPGAPLVVLVPPVLDGMDAERPRLSRPVDWRVVATPGDVAPDPPASNARPPRLVFLPEDGDAPYLRAVARAWRTLDTAAAATGPDVRVWTAASPLPRSERDRVADGGTLLLAHDATMEAGAGATGGTGAEAVPPLRRDDAATLLSDGEGRPLLRAARVGRGRMLQWTRPMDPGVVPDLLEPDFPHRLREALQPSPPPARVLAVEHAPDVADIGPWPAPLRDLRPWLAVLTALLLPFERWLAAGPRQGRAGPPPEASRRGRSRLEGAP